MLFKTMIATIGAVAICLFSGQLAVAKEVSSPTTGGQNALDNAIVQRMDEAGIIGLGAAIIVDKKVAWMKGYGFADRERAVPFTPEIVMNIGSISKTFTGVALMRAVETGKLPLDEDINRYLPFKIVNPHLPDEKITLR